MRATLVILAAARFDRDFVFVVTGVLDREQDTSISIIGKPPQELSSHCPTRRELVCGIGRREGWSWLCQPQGNLPIMTSVAINEVPKGF